MFYRSKESHRNWRNYADENKSRHREMLRRNGIMPAKKPAAKKASAPVRAGHGQGN